MALPPRILESVPRMARRPRVFCVTPSERPDLALLLGESRWLAALARRLVGDGLEADELAQETLATAIERPPATDRPLRGWLATVLRGRLADRRREELARARREELGARVEALPATDDVVAKAEQQRLLVDALLALDEPYRTTVLLRFFEDLPPLAGEPRPLLPWIAGATIVNGTTKAVLAALAVAVLVGAWAWLGGHSGSPGAVESSGVASSSAEHGPRAPAEVRTTPSGEERPE